MNLASASSMPSSMPERGARASEALARINEILGTDGQASPQTGGRSSTAQPGTEASADAATPWTPRETMIMSGAALFYSLVVLLVASLLARGLKTSEQAIRLFTVVLIINSAVFFIVAGYSSQQIAPAFGLLGTMAGYVLGKSQDSGKDQAPRKDQDPGKE